MNAISNKNDNIGIRKLDNFTSNLVLGNFRFLYVFRDGSFLKKKGKIYYRKTKRFGPPILIFPVSNLDGLTDERRTSMAEDINKDVIWIQKSDTKNFSRILKNI
jgi:hypothetical protein